MAGRDRDGVEAGAACVRRIKGCWDLGPP